MNFDWDDNLFHKQITLYVLCCNELVRVSIYDPNLQKRFGCPYPFAQRCKEDMD